MAATAEQKFNAAVKVIRGLPKNGSFQPSHDLMLKFYAYYKQATEGPCTIPKPSIWSVVNRRKWDAWAELGDMERERAMVLYVEELKNIVETMPQTEQVAQFVETLGSFYELIEDEKEETTLDVKTGLARGSLQVNGGGDLSLDHSAVIGEMLKINNNDSKTSDGPVADSDWGILSGQASNGIVDNLSSDEEDEEEDGNEAEGAERMGMMKRIESGSDTDEFCDTSDQMVQIPGKISRLQESLTSTPVDGKRETRVRFAPHHTNMGSDERASVSNNSSDLSEMMASRLALGTATGLSFLPPQSSAFAPRNLTESLCVNNSFSSLVSLAGNDSVAGDLINDDNDNSIEDDTTLDDGSISFNPGRELLTSRGGGVEEGPGQGDQSSQVGRVGTSTGFSGRGRVDRRVGDDGRHVPALPGSSGGGESPGGEGRQPYGHLDEQILLTLIRLQQDMADISNRLASLELIVKLQREEHAKKPVKYSKWWPFTGMSKTMVFLLVVWPFFAPFLMNVLCRQRRSHR